MKGYRLAFIFNNYGNTDYYLKIYNLLQSKYFLNPLKVFKDCLKFIGTL